MHKQFTEKDVSTEGFFPRIYCDRSELVDAPLWWQGKGLQQTASGYGGKLTMREKIHFEGKLYRLYCTIYSNVGSVWFVAKGRKIYVDKRQTPCFKGDAMQKRENYKGIDYGLGQSNIDRQTGIRFGVISQNSVSSDSIDQIFQSGRNIGYEEALKEYLAEKRAEYAEKFGDDPDAEDFDEDSATEWFSDRYESDNGLNDYLYEHDGYKLTGCLQNDLFILKSPFFTYAQFCSPCVPGAGNLDSPFESEENQSGKDGTEYSNEATEAGFPRVYCLGHDWFDDGAPYAVFSVETGKLVVWGEKEG